MYDVLFLCSCDLRVHLSSFSVRVCVLWFGLFCFFGCAVFNLVWCVFFVVLCVSFYSVLCWLYSDLRHAVVYHSILCWPVPFTSNAFFRFVIFDDSRVFIMQVHECVFILFCDDVRGKPLRPGSMPCCVML